MVYNRQWISQSNTKSFPPLDTEYLDAHIAFIAYASSCWIGVASCHLRRMWRRVSNEHIGRDQCVCRDQYTAADESRAANYDGAANQHAKAHRHRDT